MRRIGALTAALALVPSMLVLDVRAESPAHDLCGPGDLPETGLQGDVPMADQRSGRAEQGYNCGLALVAREVLDAEGRDPLGNANMAWASHCAYVSGPGTVFGPAEYEAADDRGGVAVVDVSNPSDPEHVRTLKGSAGQTLVSETIYAVDAPGRSILVTGQYGNFGSGGKKPMEVFDVTGDKCVNPQHLGTVIWPENIHNLTISGNGRYVFATQPTQVVDISPMFDGKPHVYLGNLDDVMHYPLVGVSPVANLDDPVPALSREPATYASHQVWTTFDGTRLYIAGQLPMFEVFTIIDITSWLQRNADGTPKGMPIVRSQRNGRGHSVTKASIAGKGQWVMHAEESVFGAAFGCAPSALNPFAGPAEPSFSDVTDVDSPTMHVGRFRLEINRPENCAAQLASGVQASVHYHEFDREDGARFAILSMQNAGIRVVDVRDPAHPREVAYFNPGRRRCGQRGAARQRLGPPPLCRRDRPHLVRDVVRRVLGGRAGGPAP
jgi:hypothetical protein